MRFTYLQSTVNHRMPAAAMMATGSSISTFPSTAPPAPPAIVPTRPLPPLHRSLSPRWTWVSRATAVPGMDAVAGSTAANAMTVCFDRTAFSLMKPCSVSSRTYRGFSYNSLIRLVASVDCGGDRHTEPSAALPCFQVGEYGLEPRSPQREVPMSLISHHHAAPESWRPWKRDSDPSMRRKIYGPIRPMDEDRSFLWRIFHPRRWFARKG